MIIRNRIISNIRQSLYTHSPRRPLSSTPPPLPPSLAPNTSLPSTTLTYPASSNASHSLLCGGAALASSSSFDSNYASAKKWIRNHPVGPTLVDPYIVAGGIWTCIKAWSPNCILISSSTTSLKPLVVGESISLHSNISNVEESPLPLSNHSVNDEGVKPAEGWRVVIEGYGEGKTERKVRRGGRGGAHISTDVLMTRVT